MRYMRCKCGKSECWTSMGSAACDTCDDCGSTLAESPQTHVDPQPHRVVAAYKPDGKLTAHCQRCMRTRPVEEAVNLTELKKDT